MYMHTNHCHRVTAHLQLNILLLLYKLWYINNTWNYIFKWQWNFNY